MPFTPLITPTSILEAVNELLTAIGTVPVNTVDASGLTDAAIAMDTINTVCREVQSHGWWFNTTRSYTFNPSSNQITVPTNVLRVSPALPTSGSAGETKQFVLREGKLWDLITNSYTISTSVKADVVWLFGFESLPESARRFITIRACRIFQSKVLGDDQLGVFTSAHEQEAFQAFERDHLVSGPSTIYMDRMLQRFKSVRPDPIGYGPQGGQQGPQQG
jgi:hypothetical protein